MAATVHEKRVLPVLRLMARQSVGVVRNLARSENNITHDLDAEIKKSSGVPQNEIHKFRVKGQHVLHGKYVLILVVALCILDCCLVITELILDIHAVKDALNTIQHKSPYDGGSHYAGDGNSSYPVGDTYPVTERAPDTAHSVHRRASANGHDIPLTMEIAHACHFASVAILGVLLVYVLLKVVFFGKELFSKKLEMFDAFVVLASFALDLAFLDGVTNGPIEDTAFILSFFVPWRVLRVVNSLVVAILDHEHYKLVVIYKSKKRVELSLDDVRGELHEALNREKKLKELALKSGVEEWKVNLCLVQASKNDGKKNALSSFASFTFGAMTEKSSLKKRQTNGLSTKTPIRMPELQEKEGVTKTQHDKKATSPEATKKTTKDTFEEENRKSLSGDSALSMTLDTEQNDLISGERETLENTNDEHTTTNNKDLAQRKKQNTNNNVLLDNQTSLNNSEFAKSNTHNGVEPKQQTTRINRELEISPPSQETPKETKPGDQVTIVNIAGNPEKSNFKKPDHTAIQISFPASNSEKCILGVKGSYDSDEQSGHDNAAFVSDDSHTKL